MDDFERPFMATNFYTNKVFGSGRVRGEDGQKIDGLSVGDIIGLRYPDWENPKRLQKVRQSCQRARAKFGDGRSYRVAIDRENKGIAVYRVK